MEVHHITHNKEIKCKSNCQCVLTNNNSRPKNEGGGGGEGTDDDVPNPPPWIFPSKLLRFDCFLVRLERLERVHLE